MDKNTIQIKKPIYLGTYPAVLKDPDLELEARYIKYKEDGEVKVKFFQNEEDAAEFVCKSFLTLNNLLTLKEQE